MLDSVRCVPLVWYDDVRRMEESVAFDLTCIHKCMFTSFLSICHIVYACLCGMFSVVHLRMWPYAFGFYTPLKMYFHIENWDMPLLSYAMLVYQRVYFLCFCACIFVSKRAGGASDPQAPFEHHSTCACFC